MTQQERDEIRALVLSFSTRISDLPEVQSLSDADYITVVQDDGSKKHSKKATFRSLLELIKVHYPDNNGAKYQGVAHPTDSNVKLPAGTDGFWFAIDSGVYTNYGGIIVENSPKIIYYNVVTGEWSSDTLWGEVGGEIRVKLVEKDGNVVTNNIPITSQAVYTFGNDIVPSGSVGFGVLTEYDNDGNVLHTERLDTNPKTITTQNGAAYASIVYPVQQGNPPILENSTVTVSSTLRTLVEALYNYINEVLISKYDDEILRLGNELASIIIDKDRIAAQVHDLEGNMALLEITATQILARVSNAEGDIAQLYIRADEIGTRVENAEGDISTLVQRADSITATVQNAQGDIAQLQITAQAITSTVQNMQGDISEIRQTATDITARVQDAENNIASLEITSQAITSRVSDAEGNITQLQQTSTAISARLADAEGNINTLEITAQGLASRITDTEGNINTLTITASMLESQIQDAQGNISTLTQTAELISARVGNTEMGIAALTIRANEIAASVESIDGDIAALTITSDQLQSTVASHTGQISQITQRADEIEARVADTEGNVSVLTQTAASLTSQIQDINGNISVLEQTSESLTSRISTAEGDISVIEQTAYSISTRVEDLSGNVSILTQTVNGFETQVSDIEGNVSVLQQTATQLSSEISDVSGNVSSLSQTVTGFEFRVISVEGDVSSIHQDVNNIELRVQTTEGNVSSLSLDIDRINAQVSQINSDLGEYEEFVNGALEDLQDQIDGAIDTWFYNGTPTLNNLPASDWTTTELKDMHIGDIYYDNESGYAYRFTKDSTTGVYSWTLITDSAVVQALADAARAQDTADHKRRVFVVQPTPPYDAGDLWVKERTVGNTTTHEIYRCITSRADGNFNAADWGPADSYGYQVNKSNLEILSNAIIGQVTSITYNQDGTISSSSASTIQQTSESIKLQVANSAINTGLASGGSINNALLPTGIDITNGNITLIADHISLKNQSNITGLDLITIGEAPNQRVVIDVTSLNVNGIFSTSPGSVWASQLAGINSTAQGYADTAQSNAEDYADDAADDAYTNAVSQAATNASTYITQNVLPLITTAQTTADNAQSAVNGLGYLATALNDGTTAIGGGLVLTSLVGLGGTSGSGGAWEMWSGINGQYDDDAPGYGIGAWYGGDAVDCVTIPGWADMTNQQRLAAWDTYRYARSLFRLDGSGYLANGAITWGAAGDLHLLDNVYIGPNMDQTLSNISTFVTLLSTWFEDDIITVDGVAKHVLRINMSGDTHDTGFAGVVWNGFLITQGDQIIQRGTPGSGGGGGGASYLYELQDADDDLALPTTGSILYWGRKNGVNQWIGSSISSLTSGDVLIWENGVWKNKASSTIGGVTSVAGRTGAITLTTSDITNIETWISGKNYLTSIANLTFQKSSGTKVYNGGTATTIKAEDLSAVVLGDTVGTVTITT